jgi:predicted phage tail protein
MKTIRLHGELGKKYGEFHRLAVKSVAEAIRALSANFKDFPKHLIESEHRSVGYHVVVDDQTVGEEDLHNPAASEIHLIPVIMGAGGATGRILLGAVLIGAGIALGFASFGGAAVISSILINIGGAMVLGGVIQMLSPTPKAPEPPERPDNKPSYTFNGPVNTTAQGQPVPIAYGRLIVGSAIISAGISVDSLYPITDLPAGQVVYQA